MKYSRFLPAFFWMLTIFYFSSLPTTGIGTTELDRFIIFKSLHLLEYSILGLLLFFAFQKISITIITAYVYAITDEFHQHFVLGRHGRITDTLIDLVGILMGLFFILIIRKKFFPSVNMK